MRTPFPYFGSKSKMADEVWRRFGNPVHYYEPFAGSLGVLLGRPKAGKNEYVGDIDCLIVNFLRAAKYGAAEVAWHADYPPSSIDLRAKKRWIDERRKTLRHDLEANPRYYDPECAGWYAWMQSVRISNHAEALVLGQKAGVCRQSENLQDYFAQLAERLQKVTIYYGDWIRLAHAALRESRQSPCAILLDPPYKEAHQLVYDNASKNIAPYTRRWALAAASPTLRIALCGLEGDYDMPMDWAEIPWKGSFCGLKERIWFSPHCIGRHE